MDTYQFMPHGHCYLWKPIVLSVHAVSDLLIGLAYVGISITLFALIKKVKLRFSKVVLAFGIFIGACGLSHFLDVWNIWNADYLVSGFVKSTTAIASLFTYVYLFKLRHEIVEFSEKIKTAESQREILESHNIELEQKIQERTEALREAIKARDEFLALASHELKTPLTTLKLQSQLRMKKLELEPDQMLTYESTKKFLNLVNTQTGRLNRVIEDMLDVSRIQNDQLQMNFERSSLCQVLDEVLNRYLPELQKTDNVLKKDYRSSCDIVMDSSRIEQVFSNIMANVVKYAPGTEVTVSVEDFSDEFIKISIRDTGQGIRSDMLEKIFQRFERVGGINEPTGLGLGLYLCRKIVEAHGGKIWAESEEGKGATFSVLLPINLKV